MGNELFSQYQIEKNSFLLGGHLNLWKIYNATHKERKQPACLFVFEKKALDQYPQSEREEMLSLLRKEAASLSQFKHPKILSLAEPLAEDKYSLGFITEAFSFSLTSWLSKANPSKIEVKLIIRELCKVISFLHNKCHIAHTNLNPDSIFIDKENRVKLSGMQFAISDPATSGEHVTLTSFNNGNTNQNLNYASPEMVLQFKANHSSDIYSIGLLLHKCLNEKSFIKLSSNTPEAYKSTIATKIEHQLSKMALDPDDTDLIKAALIQEESKRPTIKGLLQYEWFADYKLKALSFIEELTTNDITQNYSFLKCLPNSLRLFDNKIITSRFLPALLKGLKVEALINPVLPSVFAICDIEGVDVNFEKAIWPKLREVFQLKTVPAASLYLLLSKITFIGENIPNSEFATHCFSLICKSMDCGVSKIQSVISDKLPFVSNHIDSQVLVNEVYPRIIQIVSNTKSTTLKGKLLSSLRELIQVLDSSFINEKMLGDLEKIRRSDSAYLTIQGLVLIYEEIAKSVFIDNIAAKVIPSLGEMLVSGAVSRRLFEKVNEVMQVYVSKIKAIREKEFCRDEERCEGGSDKEIIEKEMCDQGRQLMSFFGVNDGEGNHFSPSNNDSTTVNSTGSELIGENFHEDNLLSMNTKAEFIESLLNSKGNKRESKPSKESQLQKITEKAIAKAKEKDRSIFENLLDEEGNEEDKSSFDFLMQNKPKGKDDVILKPKVSVKDNEIERLKEEISIKKTIDDSKPKKNAWNDEDEDTLPIIERDTPKAEKAIQVIAQPIAFEAKATPAVTTSATKIKPKATEKTMQAAVKLAMAEKTNTVKSIGFTLDNLLDD